MKMADGGWRPAVNVQYATDVESGVVVGVDVTTRGNDQPQLVPMVEQIAERYGTVPDAWLADGGFVSLAAVTDLDGRGIALYAPPSKRRGGHPPGPRPGAAPPVARASRARKARRSKRNGPRPASGSTPRPAAAISSRCPCAASSKPKRSRSGTPSPTTSPASSPSRRGAPRERPAASRRVARPGCPFAPAGAHAPSPPPSPNHSFTASEPKGQEADRRRVRLDEDHELPARTRNRGLERVRWSFTFRAGRLWHRRGVLRGPTSLDRWASSAGQRSQALGTRGRLRRNTSIGRDARSSGLIGFSGACTGRRSQPGKTCMVASEWA